MYNLTTYLQETKKLNHTVLNLDNKYIIQGSKLTFLFRSQLETNRKDLVASSQILVANLFYITYTKARFYTLLCLQEKSQLKSENKKATRETVKLLLFLGDVSGPKLMVVSTIILN